MPFTNAGRRCTRRLDHYPCVCGVPAFNNSLALVKHLKQNSDRRHNDENYYCKRCKSLHATRHGFIQHLQQKRRHIYDLHQAAFCGHYEDVGLLISSHYANERGDSHVMKKCDLHCGSTPLHCAAFNGYSRCLKIMLSWPDGDPNVRDDVDDRTPVHIAAKFGKASTLRLLLMEGGRLDLKDKDGCNVIQLASGHDACLNVIITYQLEMLIRKRYTTMPYSVDAEYSLGESNSSEAEACVEDSSVPVTRRLSYSDEDEGSFVEEGIREPEDGACALDNSVTRSLSYGDDDNGSSPTRPARRKLEYEACAQVETDSGATTSESHSSSFVETEKTSKEILVYHRYVLVVQEPTPVDEPNEVAAASSSYPRNLVEDDNEERPLSDLLPYSSSLTIAQGLANETHEVSSEFLPYEIIARGEQSVNAFTEAMSKGVAQALRLKLIIVGDVGAGKTSLTRSLSHQPFIKDRRETHGIQTSLVSEKCENMLNKTDLNISWQPAGPADSHLDDLAAKLVSEMLTEFPDIKHQLEQIDGNQTSQPPSSELCSPGLIHADQEDSGSMVAAQTHIRVKGTPRKMPATKIAEHIAAKMLTEKNAEPSSVKISIWDFAGHQLYETMNHIFMNGRSLYLVVFNLVDMQENKDKCLESIHYWINSIASHTSKDTPVILVGTHRNDVLPETIKATDYLCQKRFGHTFGPYIVRKSNEEMVFAVENTNGQEDEQIVLLMETINKRASTLKFLTEKLPLKWFQCEEAIIAYQKNTNENKFLNRNALKKILEEKCDISFPKADFDSMLAFFHDNGLLLVPDIMCNPDKTSKSVRDLVILSPQVLVDVMTALHDIPAKNNPLKRQFSDEFKKLEDHGKADCHLLDHVCSPFECRELLVELLCHLKLLYPLRNTSGQADQAASPCSRPVTDYIIPCMLKEKKSESVEKRWKIICNEWTNLSPRENNIVFDFGRFLNPALFHYLLVSITGYSQENHGMEPYITKHGALFSISSDYVFKMQLDLNTSQIWFVIRRAPDKPFFKLATILVDQVNQISSQYFKFLKFIYGPPCPLAKCPGAVFEASDKLQRRISSSSEEELGDNDATERKMSPDKSRRAIKRLIIKMDVNSFKPPYWCKRDKIETQDINDWDPSNLPIEALPQSLERDVTDGAEETVEQCCLVCVSSFLGNSGHDVGRALGLGESVLENISVDHPKQKEKDHQILIAWEKKSGTGASVEKLSNALDECKRKDLVEELQQHRQQEHGTKRH